VVVASLFLDWISVKVTPEGFTAIAVGPEGAAITVSGISGMTYAQIYAFPYLVLTGSALSILGALGLLVGKRGLGILLPIGGILAIFAAFLFHDEVAVKGLGAAEVIFGRLTISPLPPEGIGVITSTVTGYGFYASIVGSVMTLLGFLGLKGRKVKSILSKAH